MMEEARAHPECDEVRVESGSGIWRWNLGLMKKPAARDNTLDLAERLAVDSAVLLLYHL